jgi:CRISPR/Cas system-associated exonuclease Cas4 (RecB family)
VSAGSPTRGAKVEAKPSASKLAQYAECPGRFALEKSLPPGESSPEANLGTLVHAHLAGEKVELDSDALEMAKRCRDQYLEVAESVIGTEPITSTVLEKRLWMENKWSGAIDRIDFFGDSALVVDYKTGRSEVENSASNLQLRAYAVLVAENYK